MQEGSQPSNNLHLSIPNPIVINEVKFGRRKLILNQQLVLKPHLSKQDSKIYVIEDKSLYIHVFGETKQELLESLYEEIFFLWDTYTNEKIPLEHLTDRSISLRMELKKWFREESDIHQKCPPPCRRE